MKKFALDVRDITVGRDFELVLPVEDLSAQLGDHEYIITDDRGLGCGEYESLTRINDFLLHAELIDEGDLYLLAKVFTWDEVQKMVCDESYVIYSLEETEEWTGITDKEERNGRFLYEMGHNELPCDVPEQLMDYIEWAANWRSLECMGWIMVEVDGCDYLIHR